MNYLGIRLLSFWNLEMHVEHDISLTVIALIHVVIYLITPISFNVWVGTYEFCLHVCRLLCYIMYLHSVQFPYRQHYKRLTNCRQNTHIKIIYVCERAKRAMKIFAFLHSKLAISFIMFVCTSDICRYNMTFNREILGGGGGNDNTRHPTPPPST